MELIKKTDSSDGISTKYLLKFTAYEHDHKCYKTEALLVSRWEKDIVCFSSQVGCDQHCAFCNARSKTAKFSMSATTLQQQCLLIARQRVDNSRPILYSCMGEGEPLADGGMNLFLAFNDLYIGGNEKFAFSTSCPNPSDLMHIASQFAVPNIPVKIQLSLHETTDERRSKLMPKAASIEKALEALGICTKLGLKVEVNYTLMDGKNDSVAHAKELSELIDNKFKIKINRFNSNTTNIKRSTNEEAFMSTLKKCGTNYEYYATDGVDINGACGQMLANKP